MKQKIVNPPSIPALPAQSPSRVWIDSVAPQGPKDLDAAKCALGRSLPVQAVVMCDGHETLKVDLLYRHETETEWRRMPMPLRYNDTYHASLAAERYGAYFYTIEAAIDRFGGWRDAFFKKLKAGEAAEIDAATGLRIMQGMKTGAFGDVWRDEAKARAILDDPALVETMRGRWDDPSTVRLEGGQRVTVDAPCAVFSSWYEFFPRPRWTGMAEQGTLRDAADRLPYVAELGFDTVYFPPIHPIGQAFRKGKNNSLKAGPDDAGSPWAIGAKEGGHKSIHPALGDFDDFAALVKTADSLGLRVALDIAFQCAPDHPYVQAHPEWFKKRPDGTIQYAENPPKKYQDIYPFDFEGDDWQGLWTELLSVLTFWIDKGVRVFRVDNPHTKSFAFWEWAIGAVRRDHPEVVFLAEAFTKPHVMAHLARIGFNQSYTYFAWRQTKEEIVSYMNDLTQTELKDFFRPNFWPNTPDILTGQLQGGGRAVYAQRLALAATLSASYGIYGPVFELMESAAAIPGKEEYLHSEKYEARDWDVSRAGSFAALIKRVNVARRNHPALQTNRTLMFHPTDNPNLLAYTKESEDGGDLVLTVVNMDLGNRQAGFVDLQIQLLGIEPGGTYGMHELLSDARYKWRDWKNYVDIDPEIMPAQIFHIERDKSKH